MNDFFVGFKYFFDGFGLIIKPGLKRFVLIPSIINVVLFVGLFFLLRHFVSEFNHWFYAYLPTWLHWLSAIVWLFFFASFFLFFVYAFVTIANLIAAPFNSLLAEKVETYLTDVLPESRGMAENVKDVPRIIIRQLSIIGYYLPRAFALLILFFVPLAQPFVAGLWFIFNAWFLALTYLDYPADNHRISVANLHDWLRARRWMSLGFGVGVLTASMIPGLNLFAVPAAVAGATHFWVESSNM